MNTVRLVLFCLLIVCLSACEEKSTEKGLSLVSRPDITVANAYYGGNRTPLQPLNFIKLPVGDVQPDGWLKEYLVRACNGLTGQLPRISSWLQKENNAWLSPEGKGDHGWEEVP
ncbi:MAG: hypothetical protein LBQ73_09410, partial [Tannerellaceae bacterium]|nr:hypothetical protein [Tannerellaceae bacterium]